MNEEQVQQGRDALIALGWEAESIDAFAHKICNYDIKKQISSGLLPYLNSVVLGLSETQEELTSLISHIEEFNKDE